MNNEKVDHSRFYIGCVAIVLFIFLYREFVEPGIPPRDFDISIYLQ